MNKFDQVNRWRKKQATILMDSAMEKGLEERHYNLNNNLWTAKALIDAPEKVEAVNQAYFNHGSNMTTADTYQASVASFQDAGYSKSDAERYIKLAVTLARKARATSNAPQTKWVAGTVGPYGAYLHNGAEYTGDYSLTPQQYLNYHHDRYLWMVEAGCDIIEACTLPNFKEIKALARLFREFPNVPVTVTCSLMDPHHIPDGTDLRTVQQFLEQQPNVIAYGINCCSPKYVTPALKYLKATARTDQDLMAFPNAGARYNPTVKAWGKPISHVYSKNAKRWRAAGAKWLGGCCTMTEAELSRVRKILLNK